MPETDNFSDGMENLKTSSDDETFTNEDLVRQQMYKIESLQNEIEDLKEQLNSPPTDEADLRLYEMTRELMTAHRRNRKLANALQEDSCRWRRLLLGRTLTRIEREGRTA